MTSIARLKDRARKHEQQEDWEAAIQAYQEVLQKEEGRDELDLELGLYNRIGDLYLRLGQTDEAVSYYEEAADKYARSGLYNNAIALCNKALRHRPDRAEVYLKLSRLSAEQGFTTDARRWILDYAERQVRAGNVDQAVRGLEEFAESSDDPGVRVLLAQQLAAHGREGQAIEHLRTAHAMWLERGDREEAAAVLEKARSIDPGVAFHGAGPLPTLDEPDEEVAEVEAEPGEEAEEVEAEPGPAVPIEGLHTGVETADTTEVAGVERLGSGDEPEAADVGSEPPAGLETGVAGEGTTAPAETAGEAMGGLERFDRAPPGPAEDEEAEAEPLPYLDTGYEEEGEEEAEPLPLLDSEPEASRDARATEEAAAAGRGAPDAVEEPGAEEAVAPDEAADTGPEPPEAEAPVEEEAPAEPTTYWPTSFRPWT
jgi:tetratricopeptide (TPR) repeat protein